MKDKPVIVDTFVWIDYFRKISPRVEGHVDRLLGQHEVVIPKIVFAELVQGVRDKKEIKTLKEYFKPFLFLGEHSKTWEKAGVLSFKMKKKGMTVNLTDCYIATLAKEHRCQIYSLDKHFQWIAQHGSIQLWESFF